MSTTPIILLFIVVWLAGGGAAALASSQKRDRRSQAADLWHAHTVRNGVTAASPFHTPESAFNAPSLVRVYPRTQSPPACPPVESTAPVRPARPLEATDDKAFPAEKAAETTEETFLEETRFDYVKGSHNPYNVDAPALERLSELVKSGETRKTALSWAVFGAVGGNAYKAAKPYILEALNDA